MFAVIHCPQFPLQAALRHQPELWSQPVALVDPALSTPRVVDMTPSAQASGVVGGLTPTQALARCRDVMVRHRSPGQEAAATAAILQCAYGFSPNLESTAPGTVTLDLRGLTEFRSASPEAANSETKPGTMDLACRRQKWGARLRAALASLHLTARVGIGPTPGIAHHAARWGLTVPPGCQREETPPYESLLAPAAIIVHEPREFIAALPVAALNPSDDVAGILFQWGIRTVGELLALGQAEVAERLGLEALALFAAASTTATRPLNLVSPAGSFEESFDFEHEVETLEPLLFLLRRFVDGLAQRLEFAGLAARWLTLKLRLDSGELLERRLSVPQPTRRPDVLFRMLQTHLETLRTRSPIVAVALQADPVQPDQKQFGLFEAALRDPHQFQETLARLSALLGADRVGTPVRENSHRPDAFKLVPPDFEGAAGGGQEGTPEILRAAPVRKLRPAVKARVENSVPAPHRPPHGPASEPRIARHEFRRGNIVDLLGPLFNAPPASEEQLSPGAAEHGSSERGGEKPPAAVATAIREVDDATSPVPLALHCKVAKGRLTVALGPWRTSGHWWEPGAWQREEWDVQTRDGVALRLVWRDHAWFVEGIAD